MRERQGLRGSLCEALNRNKAGRAAAILADAYGSADIIFIQEASAAFAAALQTHPTLAGPPHAAAAPPLAPAASDAAAAGASEYMLLRPQRRAPVGGGGDGESGGGGSDGGGRDQDSLVLLRRARFTAGSVQDVTEAALAAAAAAAGGQAVGAEVGDLLAVAVEDAQGEQRYLLFSFHGDTNGLQTLPILRGVEKLWRDKYAGYRLVGGLDGNTHTVHSSNYQGVEHLHQQLASMGLGSVWGQKLNLTEVTTSNGRTHLQPQLNKAVKFAERFTKGDVHKKDWILFDDSCWISSTPTRDNTGRRAYVEGIMYPTIDFPSDHAVLSAVLTPACRADHSLSSQGAVCGRPPTGVVLTDPAT